MLVKYWNQINDGDICLRIYIFFDPRDFNDENPESTVIDGFGKVLNNLLGDPVIYHTFQKTESIKAQVLTCQPEFSGQKFFSTSTTCQPIQNIRRNFENIAKEHGLQIYDIIKTAYRFGSRSILLSNGPYAIRIEGHKNISQDLLAVNIIDPNIMVQELVDKLIAEKRFPTIPKYLDPQMSKANQFLELKDNVNDFYDAFRPVFLHKKRNFWQKRNVFNRISQRANDSYRSFSKSFHKYKHFENPKKVHIEESKPLLQQQEAMEVDEMDKLAESFKNIHFSTTFKSHFL